MSDVWTWLVVALIGVFLVLPTWVKLTLKERRARKKREASVLAGRNEPASIRPWVDPAMCMGSGACVTACPEDVLGIIGGQAHVVHGAKCVGHGVCAVVCPVDAIQLVFGSDKRGIDIPEVGPDFQTNVPGIFVAGELGGMGLIANAVEQGQQAMNQAAVGLGPPDAEVYDVAIVGAGPAGLSAALRARELGRSYALLEQEEFGGAIRHYPRQKLVMTRPMNLPGYGKITMKSARKEELIEVFEDVVHQTGLEVWAGERVEAVDHKDGHFEVRTNRSMLKAARVILAVGRRGSPRRLGVEGEDAEKVAYRMLDPERYQYQHLLVVGGGDSAVEAAVALGEQPGNRVTLSYRRTDLSRPKGDNIERLKAAEAAGQVTLMLGSQVVSIGDDRVQMKVGDEQIELPNDFVFVFAGGVLPTKFLQAAGIRIERHHGRRKVALDAEPAAERAG